MSVFKKPKNHAIDIVFTLALFGVFVVTALLAIYIGSQTYERTVESMETSFTGRTATAYITKQIKQNDMDGQITMVEINGKEALALYDNRDGDDLVTYIYFNEGHLKELTTKADYETSLVAGNNLVPLKEFDIIDEGNGTYSFIITDVNDVTSQITISERSS